MAAGVLLIRQHDQANAIEQALAERGQPVFRQPVIESQSLALSDEQLQQADQSYDGIVVVSPAAARFFHEQLQRAGKGWPRGPYYCVGAGTAETLVPLCHQAVTYPAPQHTGEALLALPALHHIEQQHWLFITGADGRPLIADTLRERGAQLTQFEVYQRQPLELDLTGAGAEWEAQVSVIVVTSQEQLELFWRALPDNLASWARQCQWVVSSPRLQSACEQFNIPDNNIIVAQNASTDALLRVIPKQSESPMSKSDQERVDATESASTAKNTAKPAPTRKPRKAGGGRWLSGFIIFLLVISVAILGAGGYWVWQQQQTLQQQTQAQLDELSQRITASTRAYEELEQSVFADMEGQMNRRFERLRDERVQEARQAREETRREREAMQDDMDEHRQQLEEVRHQLDTSNLRLSQDMYVIEARDLVVAAGRKLWFEFDKTSAVQLLQRAAEVLDRTQQSYLIPIRQQIANDIELLQSVEDIDVEGLALQLSALRTQVRELPMDRQRLASAPGAPESDANNDANVSSDFSDWRDNLAKAWSAFTDDFVRVQRTEELPEMQLGSEQRYLLRTQIDLQLQIAQQAMLQHQQINFEQALEQAIEWIESYYDTGASEVEQALSQLRNLSEQDLEPDFPTRLLSEAMLNDAVEELLEEND